MVTSRKTSNFLEEGRKDTCGETSALLGKTSVHSGEWMDDQRF
jgi:hypothetical protein